MLYSYILQHLQPLVKQNSKVKASPRKVRAKVRARSQQLDVHILDSYYSYV